MTNPKDNSGNNVSRILNIIFCLLFLAVTVAMALKPTNLVPQVILFYSVKKFLIILVLAGLTLYFGISAFYRKISEINVLMIFGIVVSLLFGEMVLSFFPSLIPIKYHFFFDKPLRNRIILSHGRELMPYSGEGMVYYKAPSKLLKMESPEDKFDISVMIDSLGYRNSVNGQKKVQIVLLGDSMVFGYDSPVDLGELLRKKGFSVLNLGMGGYSPQHWRDAFRKYGKSSLPKYVFAFLFEGNDFDDARKYEETISKKGTYQEYLTNVIDEVSDRLRKEDPAIVNRSYLLSLIRAMIKAPDLMLSSLDNDQLNINGKKVVINYLDSCPDSNIIRSRTFASIISSIKDLKKDCDLINAKLFITYLPSNASIYAPYSIRKDVLSKGGQQKIISKELGARLKQMGIQYFDVTETFREKVKTRKVLLRNGNDRHLHPEGLEILLQFILKNSRIAL